MMKKDERISFDIKKAESIGYKIFWVGILALILFRRLYLNQTFMDTFDIFIVWLIASLTKFIISSTKGIPMAYPVPMNKKEQLYFIFLVPLFSGLLSATILFFFKQGIGFRRILGGFAGGFFGTLFLFVLYKIIIYFWEKRNTE